MKANRRQFIQTAAVSGGALALAGCADMAKAPEKETKTDTLPAPIAALAPMTAGVVPISVDERKARIAKAQTLMAEQKIDGIFMEGTTSMFYYVGMRWGQSERPFGIVIPAKGDIVYIAPGFERDRAMELIKPEFGTEIRTWEEDESPYALIAGVF